MTQERETLEPLEDKGPVRSLRQRLGLRGELTLALFPTITVLGVFALVEVLSRQRLLFTSLASSAFLIYLDPQHNTNSARTLLTAQLMAAGVGLGTYLLFGPTYLAGGSAMVITIVLMIVLDVMHPPAVSTSLSFAFRAGAATNVLIFGLAVGVTLLLVGLEFIAERLLVRLSRHA